MRECARTSLVGVVVLSPFYVSKEWPLEELQIMRQAGNVLPLFYHLEPVDCEVCVVCRVCVCIVWCVCVCAFVFAYVRACDDRACVRACVSACVCAHTSVRAYVRVCTHVRAYVHACMHACVRACVRVCIHVRAHVRTCVRGVRDMRACVRARVRACAACTACTACAACAACAACMRAATRACVLACMHAFMHTCVRLFMIVALTCCKTLAFGKQQSSTYLHQNRLITGHWRYADHKVQRWRRGTYWHEGGLGDGERQLGKLGRGSASAGKDGPDRHYQHLGGGLEKTRRRHQQVHRGSCCSGVPFSVGFTLCYLLKYMRAHC